jgi:hypothetical protein
MLLLLQVHDQTLERGNRALLANIALGLPVRVLRRNDDRGGATNSLLFYDGLYDVVSAGSIASHRMITNCLIVWFG